MHLDVTSLGRDAPLFDDARGLDEPHVSRSALKFRHHARGLQLLNTSEASYTQIGPEKSSSMSLSYSELERGIALRFGHGVVCWLRLAPEALDSSYTSPNAFSGVSVQAQKVRRLISIAASSNLPVLIRGESGVGKEIAASAIHAASGRATERLVVLNMAALPETLAEAELFGSARGAFTGAERRSGYFADADNGTLFLDEIGDLPMSVQPKLLRALQTGEIQVVGGRPKVVNVRIIAASDATLDDKKSFKNALLQRLAGITIDIPPLRERQEDLGVLLTSSVQTQGLIKDLKEPRVVAAWASFIFEALHNAWEGNAREFLMAAQRFALAQQYAIGSHSAKRHLIVHTRDLSHPKLPVPSDADIEAIHEQSDFEIAETARRLGLSRGALYRRVENIPGVRLSSDCSDAEIQMALEAVGRNLQALSRELRLSKASVASRLRLLGAGK